MQQNHLKIAKQVMLVEHKSAVVNRKEEDLDVDKTMKDLENLARNDFSNDLEVFTDKILQFLCEKTAAYKGVFFAMDSTQSRLKATATFACLRDGLMMQTFELGEGLVGQVAMNAKPKIFKELPNGACQAVFSTFKINIQSIYMLPIKFNDKVLGVLELVYLKSLSSAKETFLLQAEQGFYAKLESIYGHLLQVNYLNDANQQKETIHAQKEEMLQNLEEILSVNEQLELQKQKTDIAFAKLEIGNERLMQSLNYAKRIQEIILPVEDKLSNSFSDHFIIYKAKDIVSGDFFWFNQADVSILAVLDCTGHGVPGAFMTMIGYTLLNEIVNIKRIQDPAKILQLLHEGIRSSLKQDDNDNKDGMEASICRIELNEKFEIQLTFAGAKRKIFGMNEHQFFELKGDRLYLGGGKDHLKTLQFENQMQTLHFGDTLYLFTDGISDACNRQRRKFSEHRLQAFFESNYLLPMSEQKTKLLSLLDTFVNGEEQRDDITLVGIKF